MIDHTGLVVTDLARSKAFYSAALGAIGLALLKEFPASLTGGSDVAGFGELAPAGESRSPEFWISSGDPGSNRVHVAFRVEQRAAVEAFHRAALAAGGRDNGGPGLRPHYHPDYYAAFVLDPDGHNIEAVCRRRA